MDSVYWAQLELNAKVPEFQQYHPSLQHISTKSHTNLHSNWVKLWLDLPQPTKHLCRYDTILSQLQTNVLCFFLFFNANLHIWWFLFCFISIFFNLLNTRWNFGCLGFTKISPYSSGLLCEQCVSCFYFLILERLGIST